MSELKTPKKMSKLKIVVLILVAIAIIGWIGSLGSDDSTIDTSKEVVNSELTATPEPTEGITESTPEITPEATPEPTEEIVKTEPFEIELTAGNYVSGIDFPSGKYDLVAISGYGNVYTQDASLNEILGVEDDGLSIPTYNNAKLESDTIITIGGTLKLKISTDEAILSDLQPRTNDLTETIELSSGIYIAGEDFPAGTYNLVATKGFGNVFTSDGGLNEILSAENDDMSINEFKNFPFAEGEELELSGVSINLVPSK